MEEEEKEQEEKEVEEGKEKGELNTSDFEDVDIDLGKEEKKEEPEKKEEKKEEEKLEPSPKEKEMEERLSRLESDKKNLQKALHEARQERKKTKEPEITLTDAELMKIVEEHKDDPKVLLNAAKYIAQQEIKKGKSEAVNEVEVKGKQRELNAILETRIKDFNDESGESRTLINKAKTEFLLEDHPLGDFLGSAAAVYYDLPNILKAAFERGKNSAIDEKADKNRKDEIQNRQPGPGGSKIKIGSSASEELSATEKETAQRLGLNTPEKMKLYKRQILAGRTRATA